MTAKNIKPADPKTTATPPADTTDDKRTEDRKTNQFKYGARKSGRKANNFKI